MRKKIHADSSKLGKGKSIPISEISTGDVIEPVSENDFVKAAELEDFMNDVLTIMVADDNRSESLPVVVPSVNGINQPIVRGQRSNVKRKYVEALARCTHTRYEQQVIDPTRPENIQMVERTALVYPFTVYDDPHPNGREWLRSVLKAG